MIRIESIQRGRPDFTSDCLHILVVIGVCRIPDNRTPLFIAHPGLYIDKIALLSDGSVRQVIERFNNNGVSVKVKKGFERSLESPEIPVLMSDFCPEARGYRHDRNIEGVIIQVESLAGDDHDGDVRADLLDAANQDAGQVIITGIGEYIDTEFV